MRSDGHAKDAVVKVASALGSTVMTAAESRAGDRDPPRRDDAGKLKAQTGPGVPCPVILSASPREFEPPMGYF